jgi:hypothetical protein
VFIEIEIDWQAVQKPENYKREIRVICVNSDHVMSFYKHKIIDRTYVVISMIDNKDFWYSVESYEELKRKFNKQPDVYELGGPL